MLSERYETKNVFGLKICNTCHVEKPLSCFNARSKSRDALQNKCKLCSKAYNRALRSKRERVRLNYCISCEEFLPLRLMHRTGRYSICKYHQMIKEVVDLNLDCRNILTKESCFFLLNQCCILCNSKTKIKLKRNEEKESYTTRNTSELCGRCWEMSEHLTIPEFITKVHRIYENLKDKEREQTDSKDETQTKCFLCDSVEAQNVNEIQKICRKCKEMKNSMSFQCFRQRISRIHHIWKDQQ